MPRSPQRLASALVLDLQQSLQGEPALRAARTTGRKIFGGGGLMPQRFVRPPQPNDASSIASVAQSMNTRRALNRARGRM
jgi:hypothetical protein